MIERRPFHELPSEDLGWLKARRHFSSAAKDDPSRSGDALPFLARDGAAIKDVDMVKITAIEDADVLMVDVL
jgi:hypothetical protein